jgi:hypothetical protein
MRKTGYRFLYDEKMVKTGFLETKNDRFIKFLGHVFPTFEDASDTPGHRIAWATLILL